MGLFLSFIMLITGILQILLFFKIWGMTNNVRKLKDLQVNGKMSQDQYIKEAQLYALKGENENAVKKYQEAFYSDVMALHHLIITKHGHFKEDSVRDKDYKENYEYLVKKYKNLLERVDGELKDESKFDTYQKIEKIIY